MTEWVESLLALQEVDLRIAKLEQQLDSAPGERAEVEASLQAAEAELQAARAELQEEEKALKTFELEADSVRARMRDFQQKSTMIKSNEDYRAALAQIEGCDQQIRDLEDKELVLMEQIEEARQGLEERNRELQATQARVREMLVDLDTRVDNCTSELERLHGQRQTAAAAADRATAKRYERLRRGIRKTSHDRRVLVPIRENVCDRCHMNVIAQIRMDARKGQVVSCENCGAMLYWED